MKKGSVILDIEPNGAFIVRKAMPDAVLIFIAPPSLEELQRRLTSRGDTSEEQMKLRLERSAWEMEQSTKYDYVVINDQVETCANEILKIIAEKADSILEELTMLYPPVADMLKNVDSRYLLVNVVAQRARVISEEAEAFGEELTEKPVTMAIWEVAEGKLTATVKDEYRN